MTKLSARTVLLSAIFCVVAVAAGWLGFTWLSSRPLSEARRAYREGDYSLAAGLAESRLTQQPRDEAAILLAARSNAQLGRWPKAEAYFVQIRLRSLDDLHMRARGLVARKLLVEAAAVYDQILQEWRLDPEALQSLAAIRASEQERYDEALILAQQLCHIPSHRVIGYVMVGKIRYNLGHLEAAVKAFESALEVSPELSELPAPEPADILQVYAKSLLFLGRAADAERHALRARELTSGAEASWLVGQARQQEGDEDGAQRYWAEAFARDPKFVPALRDLGQLYLRRQEPSEALRWFLRAIELEPDNEAIRYCVTTTYRYLGKPEEANKFNRSASSPKGEALPNDGSREQSSPASSDLLDRFDSNKDGKISRTEVPEGSLRDIFDRMVQRYNLDASKTYTRDELERILGISQNSDRPAGPQNPDAPGNSPQGQPGGGPADAAHGP